MVKFLPNDLYPVDLTSEEEVDLTKISIDLKKKILSMITIAKSGHPGGSLSCTEVLTCLFLRIMNFQKDNLNDLERDVFILSKGHAAPTLYAILAKIGIIEEKNLKTLRSFKSPLQGHPKKGLIPGIEISTGSLGMGASISVGIALAAKLDGINKKIYCLIGDGECNEGVIWEAAMASAHYNLDNLIFVIDRNGLQLDGNTEEVMSIEPFSSKWEAFGWHVIEIDGTSIREILMAFETAKILKGKPIVIISYMIKGMGVSFMQHMKEFHGKSLTQTEFDNSLEELKKYEEKQIEKIISRGENINEIEE
jgi:transketolase